MEGAKETGESAGSTRLQCRLQVGSRLLTLLHLLASRDICPRPQLAADSHTRTHELISNPPTSKRAVNTPHTEPTITIAGMAASMTRLRSQPLAKATT